MSENLSVRIARIDENGNVLRSFGKNVLPQISVGGAPGGETFGRGRFDWRRVLSRFEILKNAVQVGAIRERVGAILKRLARIFHTFQLVARIAIPIPREIYPTAFLESLLVHCAKDGGGLVDAHWPATVGATAWADVLPRLSRNRQRMIELLWHFVVFAVM